MYMKAISRLVLTGALGLFLLGCSSQSPVNAPESTSSQGTDELPFVPADTLVSGADQMVALYHLSIDPDTLIATVENVGARQAQASPQAKHYDLELWGAVLDPNNNPFLTIRGANQFKVTGVTDLPGVGMLVNFSHQHPIAAPNYQVSSANWYYDCDDCLCYSDVRPNPIRPSKQEECLRSREFGGVRPNAINRSDLSYVGRAFFLSDQPSDTKTFFGQDVDVAGVVGADGYANPSTVINAPSNMRHAGIDNDLYPYVLLADEAENNRVGVSNGGSATGNYDAGGGGYQRSNIGAGYIGWTGYDMLHAGQTVTNNVILKQTPTGGYDTYVALVVKYTDPRGASSLWYRWPTPTPDPVQFAYRLPYASLDASKIIPPQQAVPIDAPAGSTADLTVEIRDWDRSATEHTSFDLSLQSDVSLVQPGASGNLDVTFSIPGLSDTVFDLNYVSGSGRAMDESKYKGTVTNTKGSAPAGNVYGLLRVEDPEDNDTNAGSYRFGINNPPTYTNAVAGDAMAIVNYQVIPFKVNLSRPVVTSVSPSGCPTPVAGPSGGALNFFGVITNSPTSWNWNFGGGATPNTSTSPNPFVILGSTGEYSGTVTASNSAGTSEVFDFCYTIGGEAPQIIGVEVDCPDPLGITNQTGVVIRALAQGGPTSFFWEFGDAADITSGGTTGSPTLTLGDRSGEFEGLVIASNDNGESLPFSFCIKIDPAP